MTPPKDRREPRTDPLIIGGKIGEPIYLPSIGWIVVREKRGKQLTLILTTEGESATMVRIDTPP